MRVGPLLVRLLEEGGVWASVIQVGRRQSSASQAIRRSTHACISWANAPAPSWRPTPPRPGRTTRWRYSSPVICLVVVMILSVHQRRDKTQISHATHPFQNGPSRNAPRGSSGGRRWPPRGSPASAPASRRGPTPWCVVFVFGCCSLVENRGGCSTTTAARHKTSVRLRTVPRRRSTPSARAPRRGSTPRRSRPWTCLSAVNVWVVCVHVRGHRVDQQWTSHPAPLSDRPPPFFHPPTPHRRTLVECLSTAGSS